MVLGYFSMALLPMKDLSLGWLSSQTHGLDKVNEESGWLGPSGYTEKQVIRLVTFSHGGHLHSSSDMTTMSFITWSFWQLVKSLIIFKENPKIRLTLGSSLHQSKRYNILQLPQATIRLISCPLEVVFLRVTEESKTSFFIWLVGRDQEKRKGCHCKQEMMHLEPLRFLEDWGVSPIVTRHYKHVVGNTTSSNSIEAHESLSDVD